MQVPEPSFWLKVGSPGLTAAAAKIHDLTEELPKRLAVFSYKQANPLLWVVFVGGTGTGKSTLFNALCGKELSETGVERPQTCGPVATLHRATSLGEGFPFASMEIQRIAPEGTPSGPCTGSPGRLLLLEHTREELSNVVLVDTPDVDSLEARNRRMVEDLYLMADVIVFVTSQEKYADDVPFQFLARTFEEGKPCFVLLNKAEGELSAEEVLASLRTQGIAIRNDQFWAFPHLSSYPSQALAADETFKGFASAFFRILSRREAARLVQSEKQRRIRKLSEKMQLLIDLLEGDQQAERKWVDHLDLMFRETCQRLFEQQEMHFAEESRDYLQNEIRKYFSKYDLLGKPRRFISRIILAPLQALGMRKPRSQETHKEALTRIRNQIDLAPIYASVEGFNRSVLEKLSPHDESSPLYHKLRDPDLALTAEEIKRQIWDEQDRLVVWLDEMFERLAQGIPKSKEWGIYSTSILWGGLILSLEAAIGGGISLLEAVLDSAVAPFVTKGAVELFAYQELQKIARGLAERYRQGLVSVVRIQRDRYIAALQSLTPPPDTIETLKKTKGAVNSEQ